MAESRKNEPYKKMREEVIKRDGGKCRYPDCKYRGKKIEVHHISTYASSITLRYEVKNNICLCKKHHSMIKGKEHYYADLFNTIIDMHYKK